MSLYVSGIKVFKDITVVNTIIRHISETVAERNQGDSPHTSVSDIFLLCTGFWSQQSQRGTNLGFTSNCCHCRAGDSYCLPGSCGPNSFYVRASSSVHFFLLI